ncbi:MAG: sulfate ABC transporter permease subunit CysW [Candidatus Margulisiibacteriota bacterium]
MSRAIAEPRWVRRLLTGAALLFLGVFLVMPLYVVLAKAFSEGWAVYGAAILEPDALSALQLTLTVAVISVPINTLFGIAAAWAITKYQFRFKNLLISLIDLPFSISPVISGMIFVLLFGANSLIGAWLIAHNIKIIFAIPGIILSTMFITFPFVARELIPLMQTQGSDEEETAMTLGATGWQTFTRITLPKIKWGLLYGVILCTARAMGEFGAVSVVSGHIRGLTNTLPLHVEILYNEYQFTAAFAVASLLVLVAIVTILVKHLLEHTTNKGSQHP